MDKLVEKCLLILRGYHLPAQTLGIKETYCDYARRNFLAEAIPLIAEEMKGILIENKRAATIAMNLHLEENPQDKQGKMVWEARLNTLDEIIGIVLGVLGTNSGKDMG